MDSKRSVVKLHKLTLVSPHKSYITGSASTIGLMSSHPTIPLTDLPAAWLLRLEIEEAKHSTSIKIPSNIAKALLEEIKMANTPDKYNHDCEDFARYVVKESSAPPLALTNTATQMRPWWPIALYSTEASAVQLCCNVSRAPEFLHAALWTGIGNYYLDLWSRHLRNAPYLRNAKRRGHEVKRGRSKVSNRATFMLTTLAELLKLYPTVKRISFTPPFNGGCAGPTCKFKDCFTAQRYPNPPAPVFARVGKLSIALRLVIKPF